MQKKVAFYTLGCKVNAAESDVLAAAFQQRDYKIVGFSESCDIYVINTCTVTHQADAQCRQVIRQARRKSPEAVIAVMGCYAQADPHTISKIPGVNIILGNNEKYSIFEHLNSNSCFTEPIIRTGCTGDPFEHENSISYGTARTRAFLKVQDGCSYRCSYCIIPVVRGPSISRSKDNVLKRAQEIRDAGYHEIVITAVNLGEYKDSDGYTLLHLLQDICSIPGIPRIRLTSIEPNCVTENLVKFIACSGVICPHFHVPLQSGSDSVLKKMRRKYLSRKYSQVMEWIMTSLPDASIGADVMVGFPSESDKHFEESAQFIREMPVTYLHVFRYSPRIGTFAVHSVGAVPPHVSRSRSQEMIRIGLKKKEQFLRDNVEKTAEVLFEYKNKNGAYEGFTRNYVRVQCENGVRANTLAQVNITKKKGFILEGHIPANV